MKHKWQSRTRRVFFGRNSHIRKRLANSVKSIWTWFIRSNKPCPDAFQSIHKDAYNDLGEGKPVHTYIKEKRDAFSSMKE